MENRGVLIESVDIKTFNSLYNTKIRKNMKVEQVFQQLEYVFSFSCGIVENDKQRAIQKTLTNMEEYIINIENTFYLVVRNA